jgi:NADH-quinone oxidoreductase subunit M
MEHILSILIFFPAVAALMAFIVDKDSIRVYGITVAAIEFVLSAYMWYMFDGNNAGMQFTEFMPIIAQYGISYNVGIDGISLFLIIMTTFMTMISLIGLTEKRDLKNLIITVLFLEMTMVGVFVALDAMIFYVFWEL